MYRDFLLFKYIISLFCIFSKINSLFFTVFDYRLQREIARNRNAKRLLMPPQHLTLSYIYDILFFSSASTHIVRRKVHKIRTQRGDFLFYNGKGEKIVYLNRISSEDILNIIQAGETRPNPNFIAAHNTSVNDHWDGYAFEYVTAGTGYIESGKNKYTVTKGDFFLLNKSKPCLYYTDSEDVLEKIFFAANGTLIDHLLQAYELTDNVIICKANVLDYILDIHKIMEAVTPENKAEKLRQAEIIIHKILQKVHSGIAKAKKRPKKDTAELIREYIDSNCESPFSLEDIAAYFFVSPKHVIRIFKAKYGIPPMQYALQKRIETACHLLARTQLRITEISDVLCFSSSKHFSNTFHKHMGISPSAFRKSVYPSK